jgi:glycosyltransferase involved in cell wall biosynthesis
MPDPLVTVGIPFHSAAGTLAGAIRSVFAQSLSDWELLLAADGPTDGSDRIARRVRDDRVRVIGSPARRLLGCRLREIVAEARGEFIARMDADDLCDPERLACQAAFLREHPEVDVVGTDRFSLAAGDVLKGRRCEPTAHADICRNPLRRGVYLCHASIMGRREWFRAHPYPGGFRAEDAALWASSWHDSTFANLPEPLYFYREFEAHGFAKYCRINGSVMRAIWRFGRRTHSLPTVLVAMAGRAGRMAAYGLLAALGLQQHLLAARSRPPTEAETRRFHEAMAIIRSTRVPGLDPP